MKPLLSLLLSLGFYISAHAQVIAFHQEVPHLPIQHFKYLNEQTFDLPITALGNRENSSLQSLLATLPNKPTLVVAFNLSHTLEFTVTQVDSLINLHKDRYNLVLLSLDKYNKNTKVRYKNNAPDPETFTTHGDVKDFAYSKRPKWTEFPFYVSDYHVFNNQISVGVSFAYLVFNAQKRLISLLPVLDADHYLPANVLSAYLNNQLGTQIFNRDTLFYKTGLRVAKMEEAEEFIVPQPNHTKDTIHYTAYSVQGQQLWHLSIDTASNSVNGPFVLNDAQGQRQMEGFLLNNAFMQLFKWDKKGRLRFELTGMGKIIVWQSEGYEALAEHPYANLKSFQNTPQLTMYDTLGKQTDFYRFHESSHPTIKEKKQWWPDGTLKESVIDSMTYTYHPNGNAASVIGYSEKGEKHGPYRQFTPEGITTSMGTYRFDKKEGRFLEYSNEGDPILVANYLADQLNGKLERYFRNGNPQEISFYVQGVLHGKQTLYYENGKLKEQRNYDNGKETGLNLTYYPNGKTKKRSYITYDPNAEIRNEQMEYFYDNGTMFWKTNGSNNGKRSEETLLYPNGTTWAVIRFDGTSASCNRTVFYDTNGNIIDYKGNLDKAVREMFKDPNLARIFDQEAQLLAYLGITTCP